jgi:hypothetical protein
LDARGIRTTPAERRFPGSIIDALAQAFHRSFAHQSGERLRNGGEGKVSKIFKTPDALAAAFNSSANCGSDLSRGGPRSLRSPHPVDSVGQIAKVSSFITKKLD